MGGFGGHSDALLYAWNSAPIAGTNLSRSLVAIGHKFSFPIDLLASKHLELTSSLESVQSYAKTQAELVNASRDITKVLLKEHHAYYRDLVNSRRHDRHLFKEGDVVFAHQTGRSSKKHGWLIRLYSLSLDHGL